MRAIQHHQRGFTLIELVMVILIMGIVGAMVAVFMPAPVNAYFDTARRAALTDVADTAVRRMSRDIRTALPNSILVPNNQCVEFIPTRTGGRYRADIDPGVAGVQAASILAFGAPDAQFNMLGNNGNLPADQQIQVGDWIAVYNLGIPGANAYAGNNTSQVTGVVNGVETAITIANLQFPLASGNNRFHVIPSNELVVAYVCDGGGNLRRTVRAFAAAACPAGGAILAQNVGACNFVYDAALQRNALVQLAIDFTNAGETVSLYHEVHVNNTP